MTYQSDSYYLTWGGVCAQTEIWQCGAKFAPDGNAEIFTGAFESIGMDDIFDDIETWFKSGNTGAQIGTLSDLRWVKLAVLNELGTYKFDPRIVERSPVTSPVTTVYPPQVCYVVSLSSGQSLGRANHGRFYVPTPSAIAGQSSDGRISAQNANNMRDAARTMLSAVEGEISTVGVGAHLAIMSKLGGGTTKRVTRIAVGRALDTQRRRRNKLQEDPEYIDF